ncbi:MAG TPA: Tn3 family transposase [Crenalkalicoccus sp.]|jgi:hypothetical protein|nr:Tn3 family transposase [Crenalkalicoccus sp.]
MQALADPHTGHAEAATLVVNAIVLWNTTYLARAVAYVRGRGVALTDEELSHVAPVRWDHIALTGDCLWADVEAPRDRFRPLRTNRFRPEAFRASLAA